MENLRKRQRWQYKAQLHEQFAINNNASLSSVLTLVTTMLAVLYAYGYIFLHTSVQGNPLTLYDVQKSEYGLLGLYIVSVATIAVLSIIFYLCVYQGVAQRCEQFIIYRLRFEVDIQPDGKTLPIGYHPFGKTGMKILPGLYGEIAKITKWVGAVISLSTILFSLFLYKVHGEDDCVKFLFICAYCLIILLTWIVSDYHKRKQFDKYRSYAGKFTLKNDGKTSKYPKIHQL